jgi:hypothetical protein
MEFSKNMLLETVVASADRLIDRILWLSAEDSMLVLIRLNAEDALPRFCAKADLEEQFKAGELRWVKSDPFADLSRPEDTVPGFHKQRRDKAWSLIASIIEMPGSDAFDPQKRGPVIEEIHRRTHISKWIIYRNLRRYWQGGLRKNALLPMFQKCGAPSIEMQDLRDQLTDQQKKLANAQKAELALGKQQREIDQRAQTLDLEVARKLCVSKDAIRKEAAEAATEAERLKLAEKEKVISDLQQQISLLKKKAEQGSMQLQGEVLELDVERQLTEAFPQDQINRVGKGVKGGDIHQRVLTNTGHDCGTIVWEAKRTKNWSASWIAKLKEDQRAAKAELAVIVSQVIPSELRHFGYLQGVWVCDFASAVPLAAALRQGLLLAAIVGLAEAGKACKMEKVYTYVCGIEFRQHVEAVVESFVTMQNDLLKERRAMEKVWEAREKQLGRALQHTAQLYGGIQGIVGQAALSKIKSLELSAGEIAEDALAPSGV